MRNAPRPEPRTSSALLNESRRPKRCVSHSEGRRCSATIPAALSAMADRVYPSLVVSPFEHSDSAINRSPSWSAVLPVESTRTPSDYRFAGLSDAAGTTVSVFDLVMPLAVPEIDGVLFASTGLVTNEKVADCSP